MLKVFNHPIVRAFSSMTSSAILAQILYLLCLPYLSRIYSPNDFGLLASVSTIASLFVIFSVFRIDFVYIKNQDNVTKYFYGGLIILLLMSGLSVFVLYVIDYPLVVTEWQLLLCFIFMGLYSLGTNFCVGSSDYKSLSLGRILQIIVQCAIMLFFATYYDSYGLIYGFVLGQLVASFFFFMKMDISKFQWNDVVNLIKESKKFCVNNTVLAVLQYSVPLIPILVGKYFYTGGELGGYFLFLQTFAAPFAIIRRSLLNIINSELSDQKKFKGFYAKLRGNKLSYIAAIGYAGVCVVTFLVLNTWGNLIAGFVFGEEWAQFGYLIKWVLLFFLMDVIFQPFASLLGLWEEYKASYFVEIVRFLMIVVVLPLSIYYFNLSFDTYIMLHVSAMTIGYLLNFLIVLVNGKKE